MDSKLLITGTGKCGTHFMSRLFADHGLNVGHESVFTVWGFKGWRDLVGDSSFAVPVYLKHVSNYDTVIHMIRDPLHVIQSNMGSDFWSRGEEDPYLKFWMYEAPEVFVDNNPLARAVRFVRLWNDVVRKRLSKYSRFYFQQKIEEELDSRIVKVLEDSFNIDGQDIAYDFANNLPVGSRGRDDQISWSDILDLGSYGHDLALMAEKYGYEIK